MRSLRRSTRLLAQVSVVVAVAAACAAPIQQLRSYQAPPSAVPRAQAMPGRVADRLSPVPIPPRILDRLGPLPLAPPQDEHRPGVVHDGWHFDQLRDGGRRVVITWYLGACFTTPLGVVVVQSENWVSIDPLSRQTPAPGFCATVLEVRLGYVTLAQPLGERLLLHYPVTG